MNPVEEHILKQDEPYQSMMFYVRDLIKRQFPEIQEKYSYKIPFYHYKNKPLFYLNRLRGTEFLDVSFLDGAILKKEFPMLQDYKNRKRARSLQYRTLEAIDETYLLQVVKGGIELINTGSTTKYG